MSSRHLDIKSLKNTVNGYLLTLEQKIPNLTLSIEIFRFEGNDGVSVTQSEQNEISEENHSGNHTNSLSSLHYKLTEIKDQLYGLEILGSDLSSFSSLGTIHIFRKHFYSTKLSLTSKFFTETRFFPSKQKNFYFSITF